MDYRNVENTERFKYREIGISNMKGVERIGIGDIVVGENKTVKVVLELNKRIELRNEEMHICIDGSVKAIEIDNNAKVTTLIFYNERVKRLDFDDMIDFNATEILTDANKTFEEFKRELTKIAEEIYRFMKLAVEQNWSISL